MNSKTQVLTVNSHARHYRVVRRRGEAWEPGWCVVVEGSGASANAMAHFFNEDDALDYVEWRNGKKRRNGIT